MKKIDTLIRPSAWDQVHELLEPLGVRVTVREVKTFAHTARPREVYRGSAYFLDFTPELELTVFAEDAELERVIAALASTGRDGEIHVSSIEALVRVNQQRAPGAAVVPAAQVAQRAGTIPLHTAAVIT